MPPVGVQIEIEGAQQLRNLSKALRAAGQGELKKEMLRRIRKTAAPVVAEMKRSVIALPSVGDTGTRRTIAKAIGVQTLTGANAGVRIRVNRKRLPARKKGIADAFERGRIRHPVYGNREVWVTQHTGGPWFAPVARAHQDDFPAAVAEVLEETKAKLERSI